MSLNMEDEAFGYPGGADDYRASRQGCAAHPHVRRTRRQAEQILGDFDDAARKYALINTAHVRDRDAVRNQYEQARARLIANLMQ